jgi:hypothetical protein
MKLPLSGYATLRVRERRFLGTWSALQNIIVPTTILGKKTGGFTIPVNHILRDGIPNKFTAIEFKMIVTIQVIDTRIGVPARPIRIFEAQTAEMSDDNLALLFRAIIENGCCRENFTRSSQQFLYRL